MLNKSTLESTYQISNDECMTKEIKEVYLIFGYQFLLSLPMLALLLCLQNHILDHIKFRNILPILINEATPTKNSENRTQQIITNIDDSQTIIFKILLQSLKH